MPLDVVTDRQVMSSVQRRPFIRARSLRPLAPAEPDIDVAFLSQSLSGEERQWLEFFSIRTGPALSSDFSRSFWSYTLPQLSISEPAVRHALLALGSAHAWFEAAAADEWLITTVVGLDFVLWHYNKSIISLQKLLKKNNMGTDVVLLCCLLFISLECLDGNRNAIIGHLQNGLNILQSARSPETSFNARMSSIMHQVRPLFNGLNAQTILLGQPAHYTSVDMDAMPSLTVLTRLDNFEDARISLDVLVTSTLAFVRNIHDNIYWTGSCPRSAGAHQRYLQGQFLVWSRSVAALVKSCKPFTANDNEREKLLRVQHTAVSVWLSRSTELDEVSCDDYIKEFHSIVKWSNILASPILTRSQGSFLAGRLASLTAGGSAKFSLHMAYIAPLYFVALKCRVPGIRRNAVAILEKTHGREGLWDAKLHARVARRVIEIEESSTLLSRGAIQVSMENGPLMRMQADGEFKMLNELPHERFRVHDAEIREVSEGLRAICRVVFHTAPYGLLAGWKVWEETIYL